MSGFHSRMRSEVLRTRRREGVRLRVRVPAVGSPHGHRPP
ncbi:hypothetical protein SLNWT_3166 [Streptomyces albus]|uniref:Uncharacterized protein n=1 Tax=Streptomyces albus (strain ATCC 21838 / DSM 41398 / FERM P-419 / JCM 4703 / NBRC 107858) TaxID=1081613 RepID=A0A0B5EZP9_STRA4|nr:hypothetical protein SLNWT_3166 [Streptomyces albus]AOU77850.1 hypothetical protein SLNHY_3159 [Streptomyces albus]